MLPASTGDRKQRDVTTGRPDGRTVEIQRLIGRSLRGVVDFRRSASARSRSTATCSRPTGAPAAPSITGGYVALELACAALRERRACSQRSPLTGSVAAVSCGIVAGAPLLDLDYAEDSTAEVDANVVMTGDGGLVEVQATAERTPLSRAHLDDAAGARRARASRAARRPGARGRPRGAREARSSPPATPTRCASSRACWMATTSIRCPTAVVLPPGDRRRPSRRTRCPRRAPRPRRPASRPSADDSGIESAALGGAPGVRSARFAGARRDRRRQPRAADRRARRPGSALRLRLRHRPRRSAHRRGAHLRGPLHGDDGRRAARRRAASATTRRSSPTTRRRPHDGRADAGREGRHQPPRPRCPRAAGHLREGAAREPVSSEQSKAGAAALSVASNSTLILLKAIAGIVTGSVALLTEALHSAIDLIASIVAFFSVRAADVAGRRVASATATRRSRTWPRPSRAC